MIAVPRRTPGHFDGSSLSRTAGTRLCSSSAPCSVDLAGRQSTYGSAMIDDYLGDAFKFLEMTSPRLACRSAAICEAAYGSEQNSRTALDLPKSVNVSASPFTY